MNLEQTVPKIVLIRLIHKSNPTKTTIFAYINYPTGVRNQVSVELPLGILYIYYVYQIF